MSENDNFYLESSSSDQEDNSNQSKLANIDDKTFELLCKSPEETSRMKKYSKRFNRIKIINETPPLTPTETSLIESDELNTQNKEKQQEVNHRLPKRNNSLPCMRAEKTQSLNLSFGLQHQFPKKRNFCLKLDHLSSIDIQRIDEDLIHSNDIKDDPISRREFYEKFDNLLKLLIRPNQPTASTPFIEAKDIVKAYEDKNLTKLEKREISFSTQEYTARIVKSEYEIKSLFSNEYYAFYNQGNRPNVEILAKHSTDDIWFELYNFFFEFNYVSIDTSEAKEIVLHKRKERTSIIDVILNIDFKLYTKWLEEDISMLKTASDYRTLNEYPVYIAKLTYFHCFIAELLEKLDQFESMYQSLRHLEQSEPKYASKEFQNRLKSLALWYNVTSELMRQCDLFGRFLGFVKKETYLKHWTFFDRQQSYPDEFHDKIISCLPTIDNFEKDNLDLPGKKIINNETAPCFYRAQSSTSTLNDIDRQMSNLSSQLSLNMNQFKDDEIKRDNIFQEFISKRLCKQSLSDLLKKILNMSGNTLPRALKTLEINRKYKKNDESRNKLNPDFFKYHWMPLHKKCFDYLSKFYTLPNDEDNFKYGIQSESFKQLNLPSFMSIYLFLLNSILDLMSICIRFYKENHQKFNFDDEEVSILTTEQLTHESRECIEHAILVRQYYYYMVFGVFDEAHLEKYPIENDLSNYDNDLKELISIYLNHVNHWVHDKVNGEPLSVLEREWDFCKNNLCFFNVGENSYAKRFCTFNCGVINSLSEYINNNIENGFKNPFIELLNSAKYDNINQVSKDFLSISEEENMKEEQENVFHDANSSVGDDIDQNSTPKEELDFENEVNYEEEREYEDEIENEQQQEDIEEDYLTQIKAKYNELKLELRKIRDRCMKALNFCRLFMNDLELAAKYELQTNVNEFLSELRITNQFHLVKFTDEYEGEFGATMIFVPRSLANDKEKILQLLSMTSGRDDSYYEKISTQKESVVTNAATKKLNPIRRMPSANAHDNSNKNFLQTLSIMASINEFDQNGHRNFHNDDKLQTQNTNVDYILYLEMPKNCKNLRWAGPTIELKARLDVRLSLYQHINNSEKSYLYLIVANPNLLDSQRIKLKKSLKNYITLVKDKTSFHPNIAEDLEDLNRTIVSCLRNETVKLIKSIEDETTIFYDDCFRKIDEKDDQQINACIINPETLLDLWRVCYNFGIELHNECTKFITPELAKEFSKGLSQFCINWCNYVINKLNEGNGRIKRPSWAIKGLELLKEAFNPKNSEHLEFEEYIELRHNVEKCLTHIIGKKGDNPKPKYSYVDTNNRKFNKSISVPAITVDSNNIDKIQKSETASERFLKACRDVDLTREDRLIDDRRIGRVIDINPNNATNLNINIKKVNFRWQRGNKIGEGQFGTVYACINLNSGLVMAMKEIRFKSNDVQTMKTLADEISNIEGIKHENLVQFYGVELHKKEILIFMEFCGDKSSLDRISRESSGLPEELVRTYTNSLLKAVDVLHDNKIIHRDIKGANIFLKPTKDGKTILKLGDFGCSVKFHSDPNTVNTKAFVANDFKGTLAFMAPEVIITADIQGAGYTFKADVWSVGCVVIEMMTGKRPWHAIKDIPLVINKVCNLREHPPYPNEINKEARDFLDRCFLFDPNERSSANELLNHSFARLSIN